MENSQSRNCHLLLSAKLIYDIHKSPPLVPTLNQMNPVHIVTRQFLMVILILYLELEMSGVSMSQYR